MKIFNNRLTTLFEILISTNAILSSNSEDKIRKKKDREEKYDPLFTHRVVLQTMATHYYRKSIPPENSLMIVPYFKSLCLWIAVVVVAVAVAGEGGGGRGGERASRSQFYHCQPGETRLSPAFGLMSFRVYYLS